MNNPPPRRGPNRGGGKIPVPTPVEEKKAKRSYFAVPWYISMLQQTLLEKTFPEIDIVPLQSGPFHHHVCLAVERYYAGNLMQYTLYKLAESRAGDLRTPRLVDVGGNARVHAHYKRHYVHTCAPILDEQDPVRHYTVCKAATSTCQCVAPKCVHITGNTHWLQADNGAIPDGKDSKSSPPPAPAEVILPADATMSLHVYTLSALDILLMVASTTTATHFAAVHTFDDLTCLRGAMYGGEGRWSYSAADNLLTMHVEGGSGYSHTAPVWMYRDSYYEHTDEKGHRFAMTWNIWRKVGYTTIYAFHLCTPRNHPSKGQNARDLGECLLNPRDWGSVDLSPAYTRNLPKHTRIILEKARIASVQSLGPIAVATRIDQTEFVCPKGLVGDLAFFVMGMPRDAAAFQAVLQKAKMLLKDVQMTAEEKATCALYSAHLAFTATVEEENNLMQATIEDNRWELQRHRRTTAMADSAITPTILGTYALIAALVLLAAAIVIPVGFVVIRLVARLAFYYITQALGEIVALAPLRVNAFMLTLAACFAMVNWLIRYAFDPDDPWVQPTITALAIAFTVRAAASPFWSNWTIHTTILGPIAEELLRRSLLPWFVFPILEAESATGFILRFIAHFWLSIMPLRAAIPAHILWNTLTVMAGGADALQVPLGLLALAALCAACVHGAVRLVRWVLSTERERRAWQRRRWRPLPTRRAEAWPTQYGMSPLVEGPMPPLPDITADRPLMAIRKGNTVELPDEFFTDTKDAVTFFYGLASATRTPRVHATNTQNEVTSLCNRALSPQLGISHAYGTLFAGFVAHYFDDLFYGHADHYPIKPIDLQTWISMQKDAPTLREQAKRLAQQPDAQNHWFKRATFTKRELLLTDGVDGREEKDPRNITSALPAWRLQVGPWCCAFQRFLKTIWNLQYYIVFVCGHSAEDVGNWITIMDSTRRSFRDEDVSRFDRSLVTIHLEVELYVWKRMGAKLHAPHGISVYELQNCMTNTVGRGRMGTIYKQLETRHSGDAATSCNNSIHTGLGFVFDWCMATRSTPTMLRKWHEESFAKRVPAAWPAMSILCCGDDQLVAYVPAAQYYGPPEPLLDEIDELKAQGCVEHKQKQVGLGLLGVHVPIPDSMPNYKPGDRAKSFDAVQFAALRGFSSKSNVRADCSQSEFCSSRPYPVEGGSLVMGPKIGRALPKFLATCDLPANIDRDSFVIGVLASTRRAFAHVPVLRVVHEVLSHRYAKVSAKKPYTPAGAEWRFSAAYEHKLDEGKAAVQFETLYGLSMAAVESHVRELFTTTPLGNVYRSPLIQRIEEVDAPVDV